MLLRCQTRSHRLEKTVWAVHVAVEANQRHRVQPVFSGGWKGGVSTGPASERTPRGFLRD